MFFCFCLGGEGGGGSPYCIPGEITWLENIPK
jgi:hypothetical protein